MPQNVEDGAARDAEKLPEWHFHQPVFDAELQKLRAERETLAAEELAAKEQQARAEREAHGEEEQLMHAATQADSARVAEFSALRDRLAEVKEAADELFQECDRQTDALGEQSNALRERRYDQETALRKEAANVASVMQQIEELEQRHKQLMQDKDSLAFQRRDASKKNIERIYRQTEMQSSELDSALQSELSVIYDSHAQVQSHLLKGMQEQWNGRQQVLSVAEKDIRKVDRTVNAGLVITHSKVLDTEQKAHQQVMEVQTRDFAIEDTISYKVQAAVANMDDAVATSQRSDNTQLNSVQRRQGATEVLGSVFPRTTQMNLFGVKPGQSRLASKAWAVMSD